MLPKPFKDVQNPAYKEDLQYNSKSTLKSDPDSLTSLHSRSNRKSSHPEETLKTKKRGSSPYPPAQLLPPCGSDSQSQPKLSIAQKMPQRSPNDSLSAARKQSDSNPDRFLKARKPPTGGTESRGLDT